MTISLWIPVEEAVRFGMDELVSTFDIAANAAGGELIDDSETMGKWEWFEFSGLSADQIKGLAAQTLPNYRKSEVTSHAPDDKDWAGEHVVLTV